MDKKEYLIGLLKKLENTWDEAGLYIGILINNSVEETFIDKLIDSIKNQLILSKSKVGSKLLEKSLSYLDKINELEKLDRKLEEKELDDLLNTI